MNNTEIRQLPEFIADMDLIEKIVWESLEKKYGRTMSIEERLEGLDTKEILKGLKPEERLKGLKPEELKKLQELLNKLAVSGSCDQEE
ncbi:MAG: hypothetical protein V1872_04455 [bacterium]